MVPLPSHRLVQADTKRSCYGESLVCGLGEVMGMAKCKGSVFIKITLTGKSKVGRPKTCVLNLFPLVKYFQLSFKKVFDCPQQQLGQGQDG